jgi:molybdopterin synthase catalytic subunit
VSEGAISVRVQRAPFDIGAEIAALADGRTDIGGVVTFTGHCRDEGGALAALELEHYPGMAEAEIARIAQEALGRWPVLGLRIVHRHGVIRPGEPIVLVAAAAAHRQAAFLAADFVMDFLKSRAPFWKKEHAQDGKAGDWVSAKEADEAALRRW